MLKIENTYNGKPVYDLKEAIIKSAVEQLQRKFEDKLNMFSDELESHNASVSINMKENLSGMTVSMDNVPEELKARIIDSLK